MLWVNRPLVVSERPLRDNNTGDRYIARSTDRARLVPRTHIPPTLTTHLDVFNSPPIAKAPQVVTYYVSVRACLAPTSCPTRCIRSDMQRVREHSYAAADLDERELHVNIEFEHSYTEKESSVRATEWGLNEK